MPVKYVDKLFESPGADQKVRWVGKSVMRLLTH